jgi:UDP-N-acetylmuramoyl-tripeptide--D-alanyl-D-alanine ligase
MWTLSLKEVIEATGGKLLFGTLNGVKGISIDSRTIKDGDIFVALKGARFDGHDFIVEALNKGSGAIVSLPPVAPPKGKAIIHVSNTLKALQDIAHYLRVKRAIPVVGITGSNGKSTTKEMTASVLGTKYKVLKNTGNLNNQIGLPLSLLSLTEEHEIAVLEMGASVPGDIRELCEIASPDYGVLTNVALAHLEGFKDMEAVRSTKLEMLDFVSTLAVNADDSFLMEGIGDFKGETLIKYGMEESYNVYATDVFLGEKDSAFTLHVNGSRARVRMKVTGKINIVNALAASALGKAFGLDIEAICAGLEGFEGIPMRLEIRDYDGAMVISDVYNANPASMEEALKELIRLRKNRAVAVLGDMLELGAYAETAHRKLGAWMAKFPVDLFIGVGPLMGIAADEFSSRSKTSITAADAVEAKRILKERYMEGDTILIKGSRGMRMELVLNGDGGNTH